MGPITRATVMSFLCLGIIQAEPVELHLSTKNEANAEDVDFWVAIFDKVNIRLKPRQGNWVPAIFRDYHPHRRRAEFRVVNLHGDVVVMITCGYPKDTPYVLWPMKTTLENGITENPFAGVEVMHLNNLQGRATEDLRQLISSGDFEGASTLIDEAGLAYRHLAMNNLSPVGSTSRWYWFQLTKNAVELGESYTLTRDFRSMQDKSVAIEAIEEWIFLMLEDSGRHISDLQGDPKFTEAESDAILARILQSAEAWIEFTQKPHLGGFNYSWPLAALDSEEFEYPDGVNREAQAAFENGLVRIWNVLSSESCKYELINRADANIASPGTPIDKKEKLQIYVKIAGEENIASVPLLEIDKSIEGLKHIFPDRSVKFYRNPGP